MTPRRSDLILRGGENVSPAEIESVLGEHPAVRECAVVGVPHPDLGEEVAAVMSRHLERTAANGGNVGGYFTLTFEKTPAGWRIIVDHTS